MFRYFGFSWNAADPTQTNFARALDASIRATQGWRVALAAAHLRVYTTGGRAGVNGSYPLLRGDGVVLGRLFRRRHDAAHSGDIILSAGEADRILATNGRALVDDYWGRYVAVLGSGTQPPAILRDPSGALPGYLTRIDSVTVFFSWLEDFIAFTHGSPALRVDWDAISALMSLGHLGSTGTALEGISQILPGQLMALGNDGPAPRTLWSAVEIARHPIDDTPAAAAHRLRQTVLDCVQAWSSCHDAALVRLSGGVDSAILLGSLRAKPSTTRITCLNYYANGSDSDERRYARLAAQRAGVTLIERAQDASFQMNALLAVHRTPVPESYLGRMDSSSADAELAATHGVSAMFTGTGGDQVFFQRLCTWPAADYLRLRGLDRGFVQASLDAARLGRVSIWRAMRRAMADRRHRADPRLGVGRLFTLVRADAIGHASDLDRYLHPDLIAAMDLPIGKFHQVQDIVHPLGYYDPYRPESAPELVNPLLSQPLLELCLGLPTWLLTHGGRGRALARRAFAHELPREIADRQSKGSMEEHVTTILHRNLPWVRSLLLDGQLVARGFLDREKLEAALAGRLSAVRGHPGEIHHHVAIEAWLQRLAAPTGR